MYSAKPVLYLFNQACVVCIHQAHVASNIPVAEVAEESRELMRRAIEEAEAEMRRRMELIHQIRAMEAVPAIRQKFVDLTATSGHGLLSEMSIVEVSI